MLALNRDTYNLHAIIYNDRTNFLNSDTICKVDGYNGSDSILEPLKAHPKIVDTSYLSICNGTRGKG